MHTSTMMVHTWRRVRRYWLPSRRMTRASSHLLISFRLSLTLSATFIDSNMVPSKASVVSIR